MEIIVVLGCKNLNKMKKRLFRAIEEFKSSPCEYIDPDDTSYRTILKCFLFTGGAMHGDKTEADVMEELAIQNGIDSKFIFKESQSQSTIENMLFSKKLLDHSFPYHSCLVEKPSLIICTSSFHIKRSMILANFILKGYNMKFIHTNETVTMKLQEREWIAAAKTLDSLLNSYLDTPVILEN